MVIKCHPLAQVYSSGILPHPEGWNHQGGDSHRPIYNKWMIEWLLCIFISHQSVCGCQSDRLNDGNKQQEINHSWKREKRWPRFLTFVVVMEERHCSCFTKAERNYGLCRAKGQRSEFLALNMLLHNFLRNIKVKFQHQMTVIVKWYISLSKP